MSKVACCTGTGICTMCDGFQALKFHMFLMDNKLCGILPVSFDPFSSLR